MLSSLVFQRLRNAPPSFSTFSKKFIAISFLPGRGSKKTLEAALELKESIHELRTRNDAEALRNIYRILDCDNLSLASTNLQPRNAEAVELGSLARSLGLYSHRVSPL